MREVNAPQGDESFEVVCSWCGGVIRRATAKPTRGMCQPCFARMMREHGRAQRLRSDWPGASDR